MSKLVRIFKRGPALVRITDTCSVCGEVIPVDMTREGNHHLYCQPTADAPVTAPATHTPGPWKVTGDCIRSDNHPDGTGALLLEAGPMFHNYTPNKEEIAANLRLAAAAPALLEAAQAMYELHRDGVSHQLQFHQRAAALVVLHAAITTASFTEEGDI